MEMDEAKKICVYSGTAHPQLSHDIAEYLGITDDTLRERLK